MSVNVVIKSIFDNKGIKDAQKQFAAIGKDLSRVAGGIAVGVGVAGAVTAKFASSAIKAAEGVQQANNRLAQVNQSMGLFGTQTDVVTNRLIKFAEANELSTAVDAEVIKATQAKLLTFKNLAQTADETGGSFDRATKAALDLAAAGFGSAETNAVQLGKALQDPIKGITALARAGVTFTAQEKDKIKTLVESGKVLEAQNLILSAIETQVGGTAEATAKSSDKIKLAFDNVLESAGEGLSPAFETLATVLTEDVAPILTDFAEDIGPTVSHIIEVIADVLKQATDASTPLGQSFQGVRDAFKLLGDTLNNGRSDVETTADTVGMLADALNWALTTLSSFIAFLQTAGVAFEALFKGDWKTFTDWLTSDPIDFQKEMNAAKNGINDVTAALKKSNNAWANSWVKRGEYAKAQMQAAGGGGGGGGGGKGGKSEAQKAAEERQKRFDAVQKVIRNAQKALLKAEEQYEKSRFEIQRDYAQRETELRKDAADKQRDIIRQSMARLTDAFRSATAAVFNVETTRQLETQVKKLSSSLTVTTTKETEKLAAGSVQNVVEQLRKKLNNARNLITNASLLASRGFSQTFIEEVINTGAETGNELATAILEASPETQAELAQLFKDLEKVSESGMNALAQKIYDEQGLATQELKDLYTQVQKDLDDALIAEQKRLADALVAAAEAFQTSIKEIKDDFLSDLEEFDGAFAGLGNTIKAFLDKLKGLQGTSVTDVQKALTAPGSGSILEKAQVTNDVVFSSLAPLKQVQGLVVDSVADIAKTTAYVNERIKAANTYIKSSSSNAVQEASARASIENWTKQLNELQGKAATGTAVGTTININVKTDTTQSQAMVGKTIGNIVTKYVTQGGQVLVSGAN
jgi:tetratricopeptide (TPR) repeat protein